MKKAKKSQDIFFKKVKTPRNFLEKSWKAEKTFSLPKNLKSSLIFYGKAEVKAGKAEFFVENPEKPKKPKSQKKAEKPSGGSSTYHIQN